MNEFQRLLEAADYLKKQIPHKPVIGMILGSGLGILADEAQHPTVIPYEDIPHFPVSTVEGHAGQLVFGEIQGKQVMILQGRFHYYEGYSMQEVVFPVRVMKLLGINNLLVTNACGGVNRGFSPGDLMIIRDHIKFSDDSPLRGRNIDELGPRFNDMSQPYSPDLRIMAAEAAASIGIPLHQGVYAYFSGPSFETPAEIRMAGILGADVVGMSTAPEVIAAAHAGMKVLGISCVTNMAAGILQQPLNHEEVLETGRRTRKKFASLIRETVLRWQVDEQ